MDSPIPQPRTKTASSSVVNVVVGVDERQHDEAGGQQCAAGDRHRPVADADGQPCADHGGRDPTEEQRRQHLTRLSRRAAEHTLDEKRDERNRAEHRHADHEDHEQRA